MENAKNMGNNSDRSDLAERCRWWLTPLAGFGAGVLAPTIYLICGGSDGSWFAGVPLWAYVPFYPGFVAGYHYYYHFQTSEAIARVVGCITVGLTYGLIALAASLLKRLAWKNGKVGPEGRLLLSEGRDLEDAKL